MTNLTYTSVDRILSKLHRELGDIDVPETDIIEWIGEALEFATVNPILKETVAFLQVKNFQAPVPMGLQTVLQIARNNNPTQEESYVTAEEVVAEIEEETDCPSTDCQGNVIPYYDKPCFRTYFDVQWSYGQWIKSERYYNSFTPVRLASHIFFKSLVCKERDQTPYTSCRDEYTIIGDMEKIFRFSFEEGQVAVSFTKAAMSDGGYPLIPDNILTLQQSPIM